MYRPFKIFLGFIALIICIDAIVLGFFWSPFFYTGLVAVLAVVWAWYPENKAIETGEDGWDLGYGVNIENPRRPSKQRVVLQDKVLKLGFLGLGAPGSGKTVSLAVGLLHYFSRTMSERIGRDVGWIMGCGKGDKEVYQYAVAVGAQPDYFFSSELNETDELNLFDGDVDTVLDIWSSLLIPTGTNEYYGNKQKTALRVTIPLIKALAEKKSVSVNLRDLYAILKSSDIPIKVLADARANGVDPQLIAEADQYFQEDYEKRLEGIDGLLNSLYAFVGGKKNDRINSYNPKIVLSEVIANNKRLYMHLPYSNYAYDVNYAICETITAYARYRQSYVMDRDFFPVVLDDYGGMFYEGLAKATARWRAAGMALFFMFQSKAQQDEIAVTFADQTDDTVSTKIFLRTMGEATTRWGSQMMGTFSDVQLSVSDRSDDRLDGSSIGTREEPRVKPEEFKALHDGEAFISTTFKQDAGRIESTHLKVRFPLLETEHDHDAVTWPECSPLETKPGLGLWDDLMSSTVEGTPAKPSNEVSDQGPTDNEPVINRDDFSDEIDEEAEQW